MQSARSRPRTSVAAQARYALSTPPLKATITESNCASRSKSGLLLVKILFFVEGVLVVLVDIVLVVFLKILVVFVVVVVEIVVVEVVLIVEVHLIIEIVFIFQIIVQRLIVEIVIIAAASW
jgi:hypothetical protein